MGTFVTDGDTLFPDKEPHPKRRLRSDQEPKHFPRALEINKLKHAALDLRAEVTEPTRGNVALSSRVGVLEAAGGGTPANPGDFLVTATGATQARALKDRFRDGGTSVLERIPSQYHAGIQIGSTAVDVYGWIQEAFEDAKEAGGGTIVAPKGKYVCASPLSSAGANGITLRGSGANGQHEGGTEIVYTGSAAETFLNISSNSNFKAYDISFRYTSDAFAGTLVAVPLSSVVVFDGCTFSSRSYGSPFHASAEYLLDLNKSTEVDITDSSFSGAQWAIRGAHQDGTGWANTVTLKNARFATSFVLGCIRNPHIAWDIGGSSFQALRHSDGETHGRGKAIVMSDGISGLGISIHGSYFADASSVIDKTAWAWIELRGQGLEVCGNFINGTGDHNAVGVRLTGPSLGVKVSGNALRSLYAGVDLGSGLGTGVVIEANSYDQTENEFVGTPAAITRGLPREVRVDVAGEQEVARFTNAANSGIGDGQMQNFHGDAGALRAQWGVKRTGVAYSPYAFVARVWKGETEEMVEAFRAEKDGALSAAYKFTPRSAASAPDGSAFLDSADGTLKFKDGSSNVVGVQNAQAAAQADSTATDTAGIVSDFNALLAKLRAAGLLAS